MKEALVAGGAIGEPRRVMQELVNKNGLIREADSESIYKFRHKTFQEFLAAWHIVHDSSSLSALHAHIGDAYWEVSVQFYFGIQAIDGISDKLQQELHGLCDEIEQRFAKGTKQRRQAVLTMAKTCQDLLQYSHTKFGDEPKIRQLLQRLIEASGGHEESLSDRIKLGQMFASIDDPRLSEDNRWVSISAGPFWRGASPKDKEAAAREKPGGWVMLSQDYLVSRWPVTVAEYQRFIDDHGYIRRQYWSSGGWSWRKNVSDRQRRFSEEVSNWPVTGVSWWEAEAYCRWLSENPPRKGWIVRLPTEAEWERAARDGQGSQKIYPWGDTWNPRYALSAQSGVKHPVSVGLFPEGQSEEGFWDMSSNVRQWCMDGAEFSRSDYTSAASRDPLTSPDVAPNRVIRGGSWGSSGPGGLRVSCRGRLGPWFRDGFVGFRPVCAPGHLKSVP